MRTQHAHYGCGTVFRVAVNTGVPTLEMLVVKDWQGQRERKRTETRMEESEGGREGIQETKEKKIDVLAWVDCNKDKEKCDEKYKGAKMGLRGGQKIIAERSLFDCLSPPSTSPNQPYTGRRQDQEHKQVDRTTCKGKTQTTETLHTYKHSHTHTYTHTFLLWTVFLCAGELSETALSGKRHQLHNLCHCPPWKHTYTEVAVFAV